MFWYVDYSPIGSQKELYPDNLKVTESNDSSQSDPFKKMTHFKTHELLFKLFYIWELESYFLFLQSHLNQSFIKGKFDLYFNEIYKLTFSLAKACTLFWKFFSTFWWFVFVHVYVCGQNI